MWFGYEPEFSLTEYLPHWLREHQWRKVLSALRDRFQARDIEASYGLISLWPSWVLVIPYLEGMPPVFLTEEKSGRQISVDVARDGIDALRRPFPFLVEAYDVLFGFHLYLQEQELDSPIYSTEDLEVYQAPFGVVPHEPVYWLKRDGARDRYVITPSDEQGRVVIPRGEPRPVRFWFPRRPFQFLYCLPSGEPLHWDALELPQRAVGAIFGVTDDEIFSAGHVESRARMNTMEKPLVAILHEMSLLRRYRVSRYWEETRLNSALLCWHPDRRWYRVSLSRSPSNLVLPAAPDIETPEVDIGVDASLINRPGATERRTCGTNPRRAPGARWVTHRWRAG